jgi:hypothetical protein
MALSILIATLFFVLLGITMGIHYLGRVALTRAESSSSSPAIQRLHRFIPLFSKDYYIRTSVALFLYSYSQVTSVVFQYLHCVPAGNGETVVYTSPTINCSDATYKAWLPIVILMLIFDVIGAPVAFGAFLWYKRDYFCAGVKGVDKSNQFALRWGILFEPYKQNRYWWQIVVLVRRVLCAILNTYIITGLQWKMAGLLMIHFASLQIQVHLNPHTSTADNIVEAIALGTLVCLTCFLTANPPPYPVWLQVVIFLFIVIPVIAFLVFFIFLRVINRRTVLDRGTETRNKVVVDDRGVEMHSSTNRDGISNVNLDNTSLNSVDVFTSNPLAVASFVRRSLGSLG